jgi:outer membrane protein assembly factor BamE (lipoprotein component of BamABCDE complex)
MSPTLQTVDAHPRVTQQKRSFIMKTSLTLSILLSSLALAALPGLAAAATPDNHVTEAQIDAVQAGETSSDVMQSLGKPANTTKWMDGSTSLVYRTYDSLEGRQDVYVDLDKAGKVTEVEVLRTDD